MNKYSIILLLLLMTGNILKAQDTGKSEISKNSFYFEFGTNVIVSSTSLNYERLFFRSESEKLSVYGRAGFGGTAIFWDNAGWGGITAITFLSGKYQYHFEANVGLFTGWEYSMPSYVNQREIFYVPVLDLGFRYQKPGQSFIFRAKVGTLGLGVALGYGF